MAEPRSPDPSFDRFTSGPPSSSAPSPSEKVAFFHVVKTGGVSFRRILSSIYGSASQVCYDPALDAIAAALPTASSLEFHSFQLRGRLTHMHSELSRLHRWDLLDGRHNFTMLRDPVDHAVSLCYHLLRKRSLVEPVYRALNLPFPSSLEEYLDGSHHFDVHTAFFSNRYPMDTGDALNRADLARAKDLLLRLRMHVGLTSQFADSMNIFERVTGRRVPGGIIHFENWNPDRPPLSAVPERLKDRILEQSSLDTELYAFGRELFLEDLARCGSTPEYTFIQAPPDDSIHSTSIPPAEIAAAAAQPSTPPSTSEETPIPARKAVFFHIMKTGGMTFRRILQTIYGAGFHEIDDPQVDAIQAALTRFECIEFHTLPFAGDFVHMHSRLAEGKRWDLLAGTDIFTMLREPVDQVVSQFFYMQQRRALIEPAYRANGRTFPETIESYLDDPAHLNNQLAFFMGKYRLKSGQDVGREDLGSAKQLMLSLDVHPGLTERFAESVHIFETITGKHLPGGVILNQNRNADRPTLRSVSAKIKDRICDLSQLDVELYNFARDLFMRDVAQCGPTRFYTFRDSV